MGQEKKQGVDRFQMFSRTSTDLANELNEDVEIKTNQEWFFRIFVLNIYLDGKLVLKWGKLGGEASL